MAKLMLTVLGLGAELEKYPEIVKYLKKGLTVRDAAAASQKSTYTVQKVKKAMKMA